LQKLGAAAFETYAGRGIAGRHALNFGSMLGRPDSAAVIGSADVVVLVGTELGQTDLWRDDAGLSGKVLQIDIDPSGFHPAADIAVVARARAFFDHLDRLLERHDAVAEWTEAEVRAARERWRQQVDAERPGILPVAEALRACLPESTMIFSDMTQFAYSAAEVWTSAHPGHWHHPSGFGTLGYALPAAIGGCMARPGLPTLAVAGDYGFQYTVQELGTAVELGLPLPILVWDNGKLKEIEDSMVRAQIAPNAVVTRNPDFCRLAEAYGAAATRPGSLDALQADVAAAFAADRPTLIHVTPELGR
jgi:acetolactate synthase-1/2/3 large subunit/5-guanidino-2-oxopentanoate decarboxylase